MSDVPVLEVNGLVKEFTITGSNGLRRTRAQVQAACAMQ